MTSATESVQLDLFHGEHIPVLRARAALERGDLRDAHEALASACAGNAGSEMSERLGILERLLRHGEPPSPDQVHATFAAAFEPRSHPARDPVATSDWFRFYSAHMARALASEPARRMRGWCALHFELAIGRPRSALAVAGRLVSLTLDRWAWLEAARAAHAAGEPAQGRHWTLMACLSGEALHPGPPPLEPTGRRELDAPELILPQLPPAIDALWRNALELELPGGASAWVPAIGLIDGIFALTELREPELTRTGALDFERAQPAEPAPLTFLRALVAAREARARETPVSTGCGPNELRARAEMKRAAPQLFARYMNRLGLGFG